MTAYRVHKALNLVIAVVAGAAAALLIDVDMRFRAQAVPLLWLPSLVAVLLYQRHGWRGLFAALLGAAAARAALSPATAATLLLTQALVEGGVGWVVGRALRTRLPRGLLRVGELLPLIARSLLPIIVAAAAVQAWSAQPNAQPAAGGILALQIFSAQLLAVLVAYIALLGSAHGREEQALRRRSLVLLSGLVVSVAIASSVWPTAWLVALVVLAWLALSADLRSFALAVLAAALLPALVGLVHEPALPPVAGPEWNAGLSISALLLCALALESAYREASRSQMATLVHARTEALQAELARRRELEARYRECPHYDGLTGVPNRALLLDRLVQALADARRQQTGLTVASLALDGLQVINDSCGRPAGDRALAELARRLRQSLRESDTVARVGGSEFVIIALRAPTPAAAAEVAQRVLSGFESSVIDGARGLSLAGSLGIALFPSHGETAELLLRKAHSAMLDVKRCGSSGWMLYAGDGVPGDSESEAEPGSDSESESASDVDSEVALGPLEASPSRGE